MKDNKFKAFDIITNGKFVGVLTETVASISFFRFYFGIYNHKYFSFDSKYTTGPYGVSDIEKFRLASDEEIAQFAEDCVALGYSYDVNTHNFNNYKFNKKADFLAIKMPHYIPFDSMSGRTIKEQVIDYDKIFWIFDDNTWTYIRNSYDCENIESLTLIEEKHYDVEDKWDGQEIIEWRDANSYFERAADTDIIAEHARCPWWYFASHCIKYYNFFDPQNIDELNEIFEKKEFTKMGAAFIKHGLIDETNIYTLCKEYFEHSMFNKLVSAIKKKQEAERVLNEQNFDL